MDHDLEQHFERREARLRALRDGLLLGPRAIGYRAMCVAWAMAVLARWTLAEAAQPAWWLPMALQTVAAAGLVAQGGRLWWALAGIGAFVPLALYGDWLTQSTLMVAIAITGAATASAAPGARVPQGARAVAATLVAFTYVVAAFHKLNTGFFDPAASCAGHGLRQLAALTATPALDPTQFGVVLPLSVIAVELAIAALLLARPPAGVVLAAIFHVPLTAALAPAFAFVMAVGWAALISDDAWHAVVAWARPRARGLAGAGVAAWLISWAWIGGGPLGGPVAALKMVALAGWCAVGIVAWRTGARRRFAGLRGERGAATIAVAAALAVVSMPYVGTQMQHAGAMLSNLRVDDGCWNHVLVPAAVRGDDPYLRIDDVSIGEAGAHAELEQTVLDTLWSPYALRRMRDNWCAPHTRPIRLHGTWRGADVVIDDLCADDAVLPASRGVLGGTAWWPGWIRWQKNLPRACDAACVH